ncbi:MAG: hypothetical protein KGY60_06605 [Bacteroidales bacterium]|nr:hypothetical protein [Bacteroidales bacterium]
MAPTNPCQAQARVIPVVRGCPGFPGLPYSCLHHQPDVRVFQQRHRFSFQVTGRDGIAGPEYNFIAGFVYGSA